MPATILDRESSATVGRRGASSEAGRQGTVHAVGLRLAAAAPIPPAPGHQAHALFLRLVEATNPELSRLLHDEGSRKPFTISAMPAVPNGSHAAPRASLWLRVTILDGSLFEPLTACFERARALRLRFHLGPVDVSVAEVIAAGSPLASSSSFERMLREAPAHAAIDLAFLSPTAFSLGEGTDGKPRMGLLPEPALVFDSLLRKWNMFVPPDRPDLQIDPELRQAVEEGCLISRHRLQTATFPFARHAQTGFTGVCRFLARSADVDFLRQWNALGTYAEYAGVGYKTTMGMGVTRRQNGETSNGRG